MAGERGLIRKVRLLLDRRSADKTAKDSQRALQKGTDPKRAEKNLSRIDKGFGRLRSAAVKLGAAIGAAFAIRGLARFGREAIRVAAEADAIWTRLAGTLKTVGVDFSEVREEIDLAARAMQNATTVGDEDFAQILQGLTVVSGDFAGSLRNVSLVADLAAGTQMDFVAASRLVGRAMIGDTATLKRYGIVVGEGEDAIAAMRRQFAGLAENEAQSLAGRLKQINNEWSDFKQAVGDAMTGEASQGGLLAVRDAIRDVTAMINENQEAISGYGTVVADATRGIISIGVALAKADSWLRRYNRSVDQFVAKYGLTARARRLARESLRDDLRADELANDFGVGVGGAGGTGGGGGGSNGGGFTDPNKAINDRIVLLGKARELNILNGAQIQEIVRLEQEARAELERENLTLERQVQLRERLATLSGMSGDVIGQVRSPQVGLAGTSLFNGAIAPSVRASAEPDMAWLEQNWAAMESVGINAAMGVTGAWQDAFALIRKEGATIGDFFKTIGAGMAGALLGGIAEMAAGKVAQNVAWGIEKIAMGLGFASTGNFPSAAVAQASAGQHFAAAAAWGVLAGGAGAAQSRIAGGGRGGLSGGVPSGARDIGGRIADRQVTSPEVNIYIDPLDPNDPAWQDSVGAAYDRARQSYGRNSRINVRSRSGSGS